MPSIRIGFSTDFNVTSEQVGIGTTLPTARLDVRGQILSDNAAGGGGISTLTEYQGFLHSKQGIGNTVSIAQTTKGNLNSLSGEIVISGEVTVEDDTPLTGGRLDSLTVTGKFDLPHGGTEDREETPEKGSTRFNQDLGQLEFYTGLEWRTVGSYDGSGRGRGLLGNGPAGTIVDYVQIQTLGNAQRFGDLSVSRGITASGSNSIRGLFAGGSYTPVDSSVIDYVTLASEGNAISFGNLSGSRTMRGLASGTCSSSTRALFAGGYITSPATDVINVIDYVEISTTGNALEFGDLVNDSGEGVGLLATVQSPTRGIFAGGYIQSEVRSSEITFLTISSKGNSVFFGDLTQKRYSIGGGSNSTRGIFVGGFNPNINTIEYITISSSGNSTDFGDTSTISSLAGVAPDSTRAVIGTGSGNNIEYVTISSTGNSKDFGDLTTSRYVYSACSDSHGGLGGF